MIESDTLFILLEFIYLIIFLIFEFTGFKFLIGAAYILAGFKYSISSLDSYDIFVYNEIYSTITAFGTESTYNQEGGFLNLLYIAKLTHIPLTIFHLIEVVVFLLSVNFLCQSFVPKYQATIITLFFGFFSVGGELCLYLLRQLLSTSLVFIGMGFLFRDKPVRALLIFSSSLLFHSSSIIYTPLFIIKLIKNNTLKFLLISFAYGVYIFLISNVELGGRVISSLTGATSVYYYKYQVYTEVFSQIEGWRDAKIGLLTTIMFLYFVLMVIWRINVIKESKLWLYYSFTFIFTIFYIVLSELEISWIASRISFISDMLIFTSNVFLGLEQFSEKDRKLMFSALAIGAFWVSVILIIKGYEINGVFRFPVK